MGAQLVIMMTPCEANLPHSPSITYLFSVSLCPHALASSAQFNLNMDPGYLFSPVFPCDFASAVTANPVRSLGFWDFIMHMDRLGVLLKCRFWSSRFGVRPDIPCFWQVHRWFWCYSSLAHTLRREELARILRWNLFDLNHLSGLTTLVVVLTFYGLMVLWSGACLGSIDLGGNVATKTVGCWEVYLFQKGVWSGCPYTKMMYSV